MKALNDESRRRIVEMLREEPLSVSELLEAFDFSQPTLSAHLSVLKEADLVHAERDGRRVIYHLKLSVLEDAILALSARFRINLNPAKLKRVTQ
ncbi:MAG: metalloregulator ArsR/SmtB family transcription factor [Pseudomonadota bacterium]